MKQIVWLFLGLNLFLHAPQAAALEILPGVEKHLLFHLGSRNLDQDDWSPVDAQGVFGVELDFRPQSWPVSFLVGFQVSADKRSDVAIVDGIPISVDLEGSMAEMDVGLRKYLPLFSSFSIYLDAGVSVFSSAAAISSQWTGSETSTDSALGYFYGGGASFNLGWFELGLNGRVMAGDKVTLFDEKFKSDYYQITFVLGWSY